MLSVVGEGHDCDYSYYESNSIYLMLHIISCYSISEWNILKTFYLSLALFVPVKLWIYIIELDDTRLSSRPGSLTRHRNIFGGRRNSRCTTLN